MADDHSVPDASDSIDAIPGEQLDSAPSAPEELETIAASLEEPAPAEPEEPAPAEPEEPAPAEPEEPAPADTPDEAESSASEGSQAEVEEPTPDEAESEPLSEPETSDAEPAADEATVAHAEVARPPVSWWPFVVYAIGWVGLIAATVVLLTGEQAELPAFRQEYYPYIVLGGLVMTAVGPLVSLGAWLWARARTEKGNRGGLFTSALLRGASLTLVGVLAWWSALVVVDAMRLDII